MEYKVVVFIDSNVALQCRGLSELPWADIDKEGPILVLVTPTVLTEVDSKKTDARLGDHARRFNRTLLPLLLDETSITVRASPAPRVDLALAECPPVPWESHPTLDRSEPDDRIIAEVLCASNVPSTLQRLFVSQDIRPLSLAKRHGCKIRPIDQSWLRPKDISPAEKKLAAANKELESLKNKQPELLFEWIVPTIPVEVTRVNDLLETEREEIVAQILSANPMDTQEQQTAYASLRPFDYDYSLKGRYEEWSKHEMPAFMQQLEAKLELMYNQIEVSLVIRNVGNVQAESLLVEISASGGWMNEKLILVPPGGPAAPSPRPFEPFGINNLRIPSPRPLRGRHEVVIEESPERSCYFQITCDDFRQGADYRLTFVGWLDPRSQAPFELKVVATASNLHGEISDSICVDKSITLVDAFDLLDRETLTYRQPSLAQAKLIEAQKNSEDFSKFEFD